jgi:tetrahydromethanopterin S-methyltransferase subunit G
MCAKQMTQKAEEQRSDPTEVLIVQSLAKLDGKALGIAIGLLLGLGIFAATNFLIVKGGNVVGPNLALLSQFFIGYEITFTGSLIGTIYGIMAGFIMGWLIAAIRNFVVTIYMHMFKLKGSLSAVNDYIDNP